MELKEIEEKLSTIDKEIKQLESERSKLTKVFLKESDDFLDKFAVWFNTASKERIERCLPSKTEFPIFRDYIDSWGSLERYAIYTIDNLLEDDVYLFLNYEECVKNDGKESADKDIEKRLPLFNELMNNNMYCFKYDW